MARRSRGRRRRRRRLAPRRAASPRPRPAPGPRPRCRRSPGPGLTVRHASRLSLSEGGRAGVEGAEEPRHVDRRDAECLRGAAESDEVLAVSAGPKHPKHPRSTAGHSAPHPARVTGPEAGDAPAHEEADRAPGLALLAHAVAGDHRSAPGQEGGDHLEELAAVDRDSRAARSRPGTCAAIGVEVSRVEMYSGCA